VLRDPMALGRVFIGCDIAHHKEDQVQRLNKQHAPIAKAARNRN